MPFVRKIKAGRELKHYRLKYEDGDREWTSLSNRKFMMLDEKDFKLEAKGQPLCSSPVACYT